jgi:hypothetical protein
VYQTAVRPARTVAAVEAALRQLGFEPGFPPHVAPMTRAVDQGSARRMVCPGCRRRGLGLRPFQKGQAYRGVAVCSSCNFAEEV